MDADGVCFRTADFAHRRLLDSIDTNEDRGAIRVDEMLEILRLLQPSWGILGISD